MRIKKKNTSSARKHLQYIFINTQIEELVNWQTLFNLILNQTLLEINLFGEIITVT